MTRRELTGHQARSATTIHGWPAVFFGVPFLAAGIGAYVVQRLAPESIQGPRLLMVWFAGIFGLVGLLMIVHGLRGLRRRAGVARRRAAHPGQPWLWDYEWDRSGASDDTRRRLWRAIFVSVFFVAFLLPFNWIGFAMPDVSGRGLWMAIVGLFDLVTVAADVLSTCFCGTSSTAPAPSRSTHFRSSWVTNWRCVSRGRAVVKSSTA
jgi:hypothetical protein